MSLTYKLNVGEELELLESSLNGMRSLRLTESWRACGSGGELERDEEL